MYLITFIYVLLKILYRIKKEEETFLDVRECQFAKYAFYSERD